WPAAAPNPAYWTLGPPTRSGVASPQRQPRFLVRQASQLSDSSSRSIANNSSLVPCTRGPVNHLRALRIQYSHIPTNASKISGPVKLKLFCLKKTLPAPSSAMRFLSPQIGQNGQNNGAKNRIVTKPIHTSDVHPTILWWPFKFHGPGSKSGFVRRR